MSSKQQIDHNGSSKKPMREETSNDNQLASSMSIQLTINDEPRPINPETDQQARISELESKDAANMQDLKSITEDRASINATLKQQADDLERIMKIHYECSLCLSDEDKKREGKQAAKVSDTAVFTKDTFRPHLVECHGVDLKRMAEVDEIMRDSIRAEFKLV